MKPLKLTMSAFGSYGKETVIDFSETDHGLFLITGDTGSGKTTIFDGITFAIYGETSGGKRDGKMMRSQFASPADETFVELTFSYRGEVYTVRRSPEYMREKKRGNGLVKNAATVELTLPDGTAFRGKVKETDKKLCEIMGIDREQFTQIAMIAQGDFLRLLHAKSEDRKKIFSTIFHTDIYRKVEEELSETRRELKEKIGGMNERMRVYVRGIQVPEVRVSESQAPERLAALKEEENPDISEVKELLNCFLKEQKRQLKELEPSLSEAERKYGQILEQRGLAKSNNDILDSCEKAKTALAEKKANEQEQTEEKILIEQSGKAYGIKILEDRKTLAYRQWDAAKQEMAVSETREKEARDEVIRVLQGVEIENRRELLTLISDLKAREKALEAAAVKVQELKLKRAQLDKDTRVCEKKKDELTIQVKILAEKREHYGIVQERFFCEQAGILAKERLVPGRPCPVCGALEHPAPAALSKDAVTEDQVRQAQETWENQSMLCEWLSGDIQSEMARLSEIRKQLEQSQKELPENLDRERNFVKTAIQAAEQLDQTKEVFERNQAEELRLRENFKLAENEYETARKEAGFQTQRSYEEAISRWRSKSDVETARKRNEQYFTELHSLKAAVSTWEEQAAGKVYTDLSFLDEELEQRKNVRDNLQKEREKVTSCKENYEALLRTLEREEKQYSALQEEFLLYDRLWQTASGKLKGRVRMDFETYVQRMYFEKILVAANRRFLTFTDGRMKLKSRPVEDLGLVGAAGLELNVYVMATGKERDVKTLSGGESFLASLALALGLSDVVQSQAGSVRLESMFVDEGFGALDDGTRNLAIRVLNELAGDDRMVGIISHVSDLKDNIEKKLVVTRTSQGSRAVWNKNT